MSNFTISRFAVLLCCLIAFAFPVLSQQAQPSPLDHLLAQMKSTQPATRAAAAEQLSHFATEERVIIAMLAACKDTDPAVRKFAAIDLGQAADARGVDPLCALLKDDNEHIRGAALEGLQAIGDEHALPALLADLKGGQDDAAEIIRVISEIGGDNAMQALLAIARDANDDHRGDVIEQLSYLHEGRLTDIILPDLQAATGNALGDEIRAAGRLGDPRFVLPLIALFGKPDVDANTVCSALGAIGDARAVDALCHTLSTGAAGSDIREFAADALGKIGDARAIPALSTALAQTYTMSDPRVNIILALGNMHDPSVIPTLLPFLKVKDERLHEAALLALGNSRGAAAYDALAAELKDTKNPRYSTALYALAQIADPHAVPRVIAALQATERISMSGGTFSDLAFSLIYNPAGKPVDLMPALGIGFFNDAWNVIASDLLATHETKALDGVLMSLESNTLLTIDPATLQVLKARHDEVFPRLCAMLAAGKDMEKAPIVTLLGQLGDVRAIPILHALKDDFWTQGQVLQALGALKDATALPKLLAAAKATDDDRLCAAAVRGLGALGDQSARDAVWAVWQQKPTDFNHESHLVALLAAAQLGDPRALDPATALLREDDTEKQQTALFVLASLPDDPRIETILASNMSKLDCLQFPNAPSGAPLIAAFTRTHSPALRRALIHKLDTSEEELDVAFLARLLIPIFAARKEAQAVPAIIHNLYQRQDAVARIEAVQALGQIGDLRGILPCLHALKDDNPKVIAAAAVSLKSLTGQDFGADFAKWSGWWMAQHGG